MEETRVVITEQTASIFLVHRKEPMRIAMIWHRRVTGWMASGGHVEPEDQSIAAAALREAAEETGFRARLLPLPLPGGFPHRLLPTPWWVVEAVANPDSHTEVKHVHEDHVFVAEVDTLTPPEPAECIVRWFTRDDLAPDDEVSEDSRLQALRVLAYLEHTEQLPAGLSDGNAASGCGLS